PAQQPDGLGVRRHLLAAVDDDVVQRRRQRIDGLAVAQQADVGEGAGYHVEPRHFYSQPGLRDFRCGAHGTRVESLSTRVALRAIKPDEEYLMPVRVTCPTCSASLRIPDEAAGKKVRCPKCQAMFPTPRPAPVADKLPEP